MNFIFDLERESRISSISSPGTPNICDTPSFSRHFTKRSLPFILKHRYGPDVHEFVQPELRKLPSCAAFLYSTERKARIGFDKRVYDCDPGFDTPGKKKGPVRVPAPYACSQPEIRCVCQAYRF